MAPAELRHVQLLTDAGLGGKSTACAVLARLCGTHSVRTYTLTEHTFKQALLLRKVCTVLSRLLLFLLASWDASYVCRPCQSVSHHEAGVALRPPIPYKQFHSL